MKTAFLTFLLICPLTLTVHASGGGGGGGGGGGISSGGGGGGGSGKTFRKGPSKVSTERFELGKSIMEGKVDSKSNVPLSLRSSQSRNLIQIQRKLAKISKTTAAQIDVKKLAGSLSQNDFRALKYYIDVRYLKTDKYKSEYNKKK